MFRIDACKHCMKCPACPAQRPVDTLKWSMPGPCRECRAVNEEEDKQQLDRYKGLYQLLTEKGEEMTEISLDYLSAWCAGEMNGVFGTT